jgi:K+-sensing histidine kinase KdpD
MQTKVIDRKKLKEQNSIIVSFLSNHIKNSISINPLSSELLETFIDELTENEGLDLKKEIQKSADTFNRHVDGSLSDENPVISNDEPGITVVDVVKHLDNFVENIKVQHPNIAKIHFIPSKESILLRINIKSVERILSNLVANSLKLTSNDINIYINIEVLHNIFTINLREEGDGIEYSAQSKISRLFAKGKNSEKSNNSYPELSIVKSEVESLRGNIEFECYPGEGTFYSIKIPVDEVMEFSKQNLVN